MGEVYKATDTRLGRTVAVKVLGNRFSAGFENEARAIAALNHPHICTLYDVGPDYLVMEYIEGAPLRGPLPVEEAVRLAIQIALTLEAAHGKGVIHRDLKPGNILLAAAGIKILDFGLAKLTQREDEDATCTMTGAVRGTPAYMSPEQAEGKQVDNRSDVFSFGAVLYEMLTGRRAFNGNSKASVLSAVLRDDPAPLEALPALEPIVMRCLAKKPAQRFQTMTEVRTALEQISAKPIHQQASIAVLPFSSRSADKEDEYFSDGLTEEIINALAQIPDLNVTARTSSFAFRGKEQDIRRIAGMLDVRMILEGSVRRAGSRIRVTAELINATSGYHLWSERYDREIADVFAIQDEIAQAIAVALELKLSALERRGHTPSLSAYESFLKARYFLRKSTEESLSRCRDCLEQAIALDPQFALAHAELATYLIYLASRSLLPAREALSQARAAAQQALRIDPFLPEAHAGLASVATFLDYNWAEAGREYQLAMTRAPVPPTVSHYYGFYYLVPLGRIREAAKELERALKEDPLNLQCQTQLAICLWTDGRHQEASRQFRQVLELDENFWLALLLYGLWHAEDGRPDDALFFVERAYSVAPKNAGSIGALAGLLSRIGDRGRSESLLQELGGSEVYGVPLGMAVFHQVRSEFDTAAEWAQKAIEQRDLNILPATCGPNRKHYVEAGRWPALARMLNLPETA
jgi:serine/threonine-protein kinase